MQNLFLTSSFNPKPITPKLITKLKNPGLSKAAATTLGFGLIPGDII